MRCVSKHRYNQNPIEGRGSPGDNLNREITRRYAVYIVGLSLLLAMDRPPFLGYLFAQPSTMTLLARTANDAGLVAFGVLLILAAFQFPCLLKAKRIFAGIGGILASCSSIVIALHSHLGLFDQHVLPIASLSLSLGHLLLIAAWFLASRAIPSRRILPAVMASFALSMALVGVDLLPNNARIIAIVSMPAISASLATLTGDDDLTWGLLEHYERPPFSSAKLIDILAIALLFAQILGAALVRSLWAHQGIGYETSQTSYSTYLISLGIALLCTAICTRCDYAEKGALIICIFTLPILIIASFGFLFLHSKNLAVSSITSVWSISGTALLGMIAIAFRGTNKPYLSGAGLYGAMLGCGMWIANGVIPSLLHFNGSAPTSINVPLVLAAVSAIMLVLAVAFGAMLIDNTKRFTAWQTQATVHTITIKASRKTSDTGAQKEETAATTPASKERDATSGKPIASDDLVSLQNSLCKKFNLTPREADIARLLAHGYTAKRVADELTLSLNTVQSYTKSIYRKLDVHKKDELIEKVSHLGKDS